MCNFLENSLIAMEIWVWMQAGLPYGQRLEGGQTLSYVRLSPVFFFISLTSIGCGPSRWSMAKRIWNKTKTHIDVLELFFPHKMCRKVKDITRDLHLPLWCEETDPRAWWSYSSCPPQVPFCSPGLGSRHQSGTHLLTGHCFVVFSPFVAN